MWPTRNFVESSAIYKNVWPVTKGINCLLLDDSIITSTRITGLDIPFLWGKSCESHIFPSLASGLLFSIVQLCDEMCTASFDANTIILPLHNQAIVLGGLSHTNKLWALNIPSNMHIPPDPLVPAINNVCLESYLLERIKFYHMAFL